ncbi:MAG: endonuclease/exonuclease/phosphatase family protein [Planctomycetota bacterium]
MTNSSNARSSSFFALILWGLLMLAVLAAGVGAIVAQLGPRFWPLELASHLHVGYLVVLVAAAALFSIGQRWRSALLAVVLAMPSALTLVPAVVAGHPPISDELPRLNVALINVHSSNRSYGRVIGLLREKQPDVVALLEITDAWLDGLKPLHTQYPHRHTEPREDNFGIALFSRRPVHGVRTQVFGQADLPSIVADLPVAGRMVHIVVTHPLPPVRPVSLELRDQQLMQVADYLGKRRRPYLLLGDLNASPWTPVYADLLDAGSLYSTRTGHGLLPTWPSLGPLALTPIDHVLTSEDFVAARVRTGLNVGSDHQPLLVELALRANP